MAPWPGFEPGSGGRQPPILGLTILPGHPISLKRKGLVLKFFILKKIKQKKNGQNISIPH